MPPGWPGLRWQSSLARFPTAKSPWSRACAALLPWPRQRARGLYGTLFSIRSCILERKRRCALADLRRGHEHRHVLVVQPPVQVEPVTMTSSEVAHETSALLKLGFVFMATA